MCSAASAHTRFMVTISLSLAVLAASALAQTPVQQRATPPAAAATPSGQQAPPTAETQPAATGPELAPQEPIANDQGSTFVFKKQVQEVMLHATVVDEQRHLIPTLDKAAFSVLEGGVPQTVVSFRHEDVPVAMGIVIDNSGSMREKRAEVNRAVLNLIRASNPQDEIFVVNFGRDYYLDQDFTSDVNLLQTALNQVSASGSTALYDAIVASAVHLNHNPRLEKKVLLVITDGQDNMSQESLQEALRRIQQPTGPIIYAVGLTGGGLQAEGRSALERLAAGTGGVAYFPDTLDQVGDITKTVAHDIRSQYIISYKPANPNAKPGYQPVKVEAHAAGYGILTVRTRNGYFPPDTTRQ